MIDDERTDSVFTDALALQNTPDQGCVIRVTDGDDAGKEIELTAGAVTIGTRPECELSLADSTVSSRHVTVEAVADGILVTDLGSRNGTFYLGSRLEKAVLQHGAALRIGRTRLLLASRQPPAGPGTSDRQSYGSITGSSPAMRRLYATLEQLEPLEYTSLLLGETGVGKEHVAHEIHRHSGRSRGPFEVCDCAALSPTLIESELFGHVRGAFTGADSDYRGVFERAHRGTIFLDEIGELPLDLQPRLLRVLEAKSTRPVGADQARPVDIRVIAATNRDLAQEVHDGTFRQDLFFRLNLVTIVIPPLRQRREDIPVLVRQFLSELGHDEVELSPATMELFTSAYDWPGNVRELKNAVARVQALGTMPEDLQGASTDPSYPVDIDDAATFQEAKKQIVGAFEHDYLAAKLAQHDNNISQAARASGMERNQFKRLLRKHGLLGNSGE